MGTCIGTGIPFSAADLVRNGDQSDIEAVEAALAELRLRDSVVDVMGGLKQARADNANGLLVMFTDSGLELSMVHDEYEEDDYIEDQPSLFDKIRAKFGRRD